MVLSINDLFLHDRSKDFFLFLYIKFVFTCTKERIMAACPEILLLDYVLRLW